MSTTEVPSLRAGVAAATGSAILYLTGLAAHGGVSVGAAPATAGVAALGAAAAIIVGSRGRTWGIAGLAMVCAGVVAVRWTHGPGAGPLLALVPVAAILVREPVGPGAGLGLCGLTGLASLVLTALEGSLGTASIVGGLGWVAACLAVLLPPPPASVASPARTPPPPPSATRPARVPTDEELLRASQAESLGVLAGGLAHDFNNLLTGMLGNANVAMVELEDGEAKEAVAEVEVAARRAKELVAQLLAYSGRGRMEIHVFDVGLLVREMVGLLRKVVSPRAQLEVHLPQVRALVDGDPAQIRQVVMNLITNASDALGGAAGSIGVRISIDALDRAALDATDLGRGLPTGSYVCIEVRDDGCGMDAETRARIFQPFFTTKFTGRGLGLAALMGIVRHHQGTFSVQTAPGAGTTFRVWLPWAEHLDADDDLPTDSAVRLPRTPQRRGTLLLAEDEEIVRRVATRVFSRLGFEVIVTHDGGDALKAFEDGPDEFVAVVLDVQMPVLDGLAVMRRIKAWRPAMPVVLCTGFAPEVTDPRDVPDAWLPKPYSMRDALAAVDRAVARARGGPAPVMDDEPSDPQP